MHVTLETLLDSHKFTDRIHQLIEKAADSAAVAKISRCFAESDG